MAQGRRLPALVLVLVLLFATAAAGFSPVVAPTVSAHAAPLVAGSAVPHSGCGGAILGC